MCVRGIYDGGLLRLHSAEQFFHIERRKAYARFLPRHCGQQVGKRGTVGTEGHHRRKTAATADTSHVEVAIARTRRRPVLQQFADGVASAVEDVMGDQTDGGANAGIEMGEAAETCLLPLASAPTARTAGRHLADVQRIAKVQSIVLSFSLDALTGCF